MFTRIYRRSPLLDAGITTYNALSTAARVPVAWSLRRASAAWGHLGIQFANKFGYHVVAMGRGAETGVVARKLAAHVYIDSQTTNAAHELQKLGGARVIIATAPNSKAMSALINGLGPNGKLVAVGAAPDPIEVTPSQLIFGSKPIQAWAAGTPAASEDTLNFSVLTGVRRMIERYPLERTAEDYERMLSGKAEYRVVLMM